MLSVLAHIKCCKSEACMSCETIQSSLWSGRWCLWEGGEAQSALVYTVNSEVCHDEEEDHNWECHEDTVWLAGQKTSGALANHAYVDRSAGQHRKYQAGWRWGNGEHPQDSCNEWDHWQEDRYQPEPWHECQQECYMVCPRSSQLAQQCPEYTDAEIGTSHPGADALKFLRSDEEGPDPS